MALGPGRYAGVVRDVASTTAQRGFPSRRMQALGGSWSPLAIQGLYGWWDASDTDTITSSSGAVSQWDDKSGHGKHLVQATGTNQPTTGSATQNGLNAIVFGGNDAMSVTSFDVRPGGQALSVFMVCMFTSSTTNDRVVVEQTTDFNSNPGAFILYRNKTTSTITWGKNTQTNSTYALATTSGSITTTAKAYVGRVDVRVATLKTDATLNRDPTVTRPFDNATTANISATLYVGGRAGNSVWFDGTLCELGVVAGRITDTERMLLENYLMGKWAL